MESTTGSPMQIATIIMGLMGGLALFLFGMEQMSDALKIIAGQRMKSVLGQLTTNRFKAASAGAFITAVIQSSSVTTVLVVGFITAGLMTLSQSVGVIMGANIGTTITAQLIAFKVTKIALLLVTIGFAVLFTARRQRTKQIGTAIMGVGLIFFGMQLMSQATEPLRSYPTFVNAMSNLNASIAAVLVGAGFTALIQSSAATTGLVIVLASQGLITLDTSIAIVFGANVGTCVTALLASIGKPTEAVQAAMVHVLFNVIGVLIWFPFIGPFADFVSSLTPDMIVGTDIEVPRQIANAHTIFNVTNTVLFLPFTTQLARFVQFLVPYRSAVQDEVLQPKYLDENLLSTPELAMDRVRLELGSLGSCALQMVRDSLPIIMNGDEEELEDLAKMDADVDSLQGAIVAYLGRMSQENLLHDQTEQLYDYLAVATYMENIGDMVETNLVEAGQERLHRDVVVSGATQQAIGELHNKICWTVEQALLAVDTGDKELAQTVIDAKGEINRLSDAIDSHLTVRLVANEPNRLNAYRIESDIIENYRRIYYFAKRIAKAIVQIDMKRVGTTLLGSTLAHQYAAELPTSNIAEPAE